MMDELQKILNHQFKDPNLLLEAVTHRSFSHENHLSFNYERLETLGDAAIELIVTQWLFNHYPDIRESTITQTRANLVNESSLAAAARKLHLGQFIRLSKGEDQSGGRDKNRILCDMLEAVTGALFVDGGIDAAVAFVERVILSGNINHHIDSKTRLMRLLGSEYERLEYKLIETIGQDHNKIFTSAVMFDGKIMTTGTGRTKKASEQEAAKKYLEVLEGSV